MIKNQVNIQIGLAYSESKPQIKPKTLEYTNLNVDPQRLEYQ